MDKIYIIGPVGSGKSTLAKQLSCQTHLPYYELDALVHQGNDKLPQYETQQRFEQILAQKQWIIEDVGRKIFQEGVKQADLVIYLDLPTRLLYARIIKRFIRQRLHLEPCSYRPSWQMLRKMFRWASHDLTRKQAKLLFLNKQAKQCVVLTDPQKAFSLLEKSPHCP